MNLQEQIERMQELMGILKEDKVPKVPNNISQCENKWKPILISAKKYWIDWLNNPKTKEKFKKNWGVGSDNKIEIDITDKNGWSSTEKNSVDQIFNTYIQKINQLNLSFYDKNNKKLVSANKNNDNALAFFNKNYPKLIFVNCDETTTTDPLEILIHEIQHLIYYVHPLNPAEKIGDVFVNKNTTLLKPNDLLYSLNYSTEGPNKSKKFSPSNSPLDPNKLFFSKIAKKYGVDYKVIQALSIAAKNIKEKMHDPGYICRETEKMSNISGMRYKLGIKPQDKITLNMVLPYLKSILNSGGDFQWFFFCWATNNFPDLEQMLNKVNNLAFKNQAKDDTTNFA